jgi:hypothetical protein
MRIIIKFYDIKNNKIIIDPNIFISSSYYSIYYYSIRFFTKDKILLSGLDDAHIHYKFDEKLALEVKKND